MVQVPSRVEAIDILEGGFAHLARLLDGIDEGALIQRGTIGGGEWSAKDLLAHVAFWERNGLEAVDAWSQGSVAPVDRMLKAPGLDAINEAAIEASFALDLAQVRAGYAEVHGELVRTIDALDDVAWTSPPTARGTKSLGERLGVILVGRGNDLFDHVSAHRADVEAFRLATGASVE